MNKGQLSKMAPCKKTPVRQSQKPPEREADPKVLSRRQKQIDYGKATTGYRNYLSATPKDKRTQKQPRTPDKFQICSRRGWDGQIKLWRLLLHAHDDNNASADSSVISESSEQSIQTTESSFNFLNDSYSPKRLEF